MIAPACAPACASAAVPRRLFPGCVNRIRLGILVVCIGVGTSGCGDRSEEVPLVVREAPRAEGAPMCPWREPASDIAAWFPGATRTDAEILILSAFRGEFARRMGRAASAEENALYVHRVWKDSERVGEVSLRRVKGAGGAVELVVGFDREGRLIGVRIQRSREPDEVASALNASWLAQFRGRDALQPLRVGQELSAVAPGAEATAAALADGIRSVLVLRELARSPGALRRPAPEAATGELHRH